MRANLTGSNEREFSPCRKSGLTDMPNTLVDGTNCRTELIEHDAKSPVTPKCESHNKGVQASSLDSYRLSDSIRTSRRSPVQSGRPSPFVFMPYSSNNRISKFTPKVERHRSLAQVIQRIRRSRRQTKLPSLATIHESSNLDLLTHLQRRSPASELDRLMDNEPQESISNTVSECLSKPVIYDNSDWYPDHSTNQTNSSHELSPMTSPVSASESLT